MEVLTLGENSENLESRRKKRRLVFFFFFFVLRLLKLMAGISLKRSQPSTGSSIELERIRIPTRSCHII